MIDPKDHSRAERNRDIRPEMRVFVRVDEGLYEHHPPVQHARENAEGCSLLFALFIRYLRMKRYAALCAKASATW